MGRKLGYFPSATLPAGGRVRSRSSTMPRATYIPSYATNAGFSRADSLAYDTRLDDYMVQGRISDVNYLSQATLEDEYNTANRSRALDAQLRRNFSNAIEGSNSYATPQVSRVARSVARRTQCRAASVPPRPVSSQAAIIASKLEPDPLKRRRPKSDYAANKYREIRKEQKERVYSGVPGSSGLSSSMPPLTGVDPRNPPMSDLRRRIKRTLNKTRHS